MAGGKARPGSPLLLTGYRPDVSDVHDRKPGSGSSMGKTLNRVFYSRMINSRMINSRIISIRTISIRTINNRNLRFPNHRFQCVPATTGNRYIHNQAPRQRDHFRPGCGSCPEIRRPVCIFLLRLHGNSAMRCFLRCSTHHRHSAGCGAHSPSRRQSCI